MISLTTGQWLGIAVLALLYACPLIISTWLASKSDWRRWMTFWLFLFCGPAVAAIGWALLFKRI